MKQICSLIRPRSRSLFFDVVYVKGQPTGNLYDCGIFALAYATELVHDRDPLLCNWECRAMRKHLIPCLENDYVTQFPQSGRERRVAMGSRIKFHTEELIYCTCRLPYDPAINMVECVMCLDWYHQECLKLSLLNIKPSNGSALLVRSACF